VGDISPPEIGKRGSAIGEKGRKDKKRIDTTSTATVHGNKKTVVNFYAHSFKK